MGGGVEEFLPDPSPTIDRATINKGIEVIEFMGAQPIESTRWSKAR